MDTTSLFVGNHLYADLRRIGAHATLQICCTGNVTGRKNLRTTITAIQNCPLAEGAQTIHTYRTSSGAIYVKAYLKIITNIHLIISAIKANRL